MLETVKNNDFLKYQPIGKLLFKLAMPAVAAQLINMLYNMVDRIYIGHMQNIGSLALTGMGVCLPIILIVTAFAALISMGGAPRASIFMGKSDNASAEKIMGNSFVLLLIISAILTTLLLLFNRPLLLAFGASENTIEYAVSYMKIYAIGTVFVQLTLGMNAFISAQGFAFKSMVTVLIGALLNIILDPIFIFVLNMGIKGAALATIISQCVSAVWVLLFLASKKTLLKLRFKNMKLSPKVFLPCLALGLSPFIMQSTESLIMVCFNSSLLKYGGDIAVGAMTIIVSVMQFAMLPLQGLGQGAQPIASYNYGAGNAERLKETFKKLLFCCLIYSTVLWILAMSLPTLFAKIFTNNSELIAFSAWAMRIYLACIVLMGIQIACQMLLISMDKPLASVFVAMLRKIVLIVPLIYILPLILKNDILAVYLAEPISDFIAVTCTVIIFSFQFKKVLKKLNTSKIAE